MKLIVKNDYSVLRCDAFAFQRKQISRQTHNVIFDNKLQGKLLQDFAISLMDKATDFAACFCGEKGSYRYCIVSNQVNLQNLCKALNSTFSGRGGGKPEIVQGSLVGSEEDIAKMLENYEL